jgi:glycosyltransferase involved in cell wall biosynthesis
MKLLILTQKIDRRDAVLGFMHRWVQEFAAHVEQVTVLCLYKGECELPTNVRVFSLGKERGATRFQYLVQFFQVIWRERAAYDSVFVHMNYEYVLLGGLLWRMLGKKIALWYAHGAVPLLLHLASAFAHRILTSTASGFRILSSKKIVIGQGIDTDFFKPALKQSGEKIFSIVSVGRISPIKNYETLIDAMRLLAEKKVSTHLTIVGSAGLPEQQAYAEALEQRVAAVNLQHMISFVGARSNTDIVQTLQQADLFVNTSLTGSLDKAVLEAMACGVPIITSNEALVEVLGPYTDQLMFPSQDSTALAEKIFTVQREAISARVALGEKLREIVVRDHNLTRFIRKIISSYGATA